MEYQYVNKLLDGEAYLLLNSEITLENSLLITNEMYDLKAQGYHITLKINSGGGLVLPAYNIIDALITTESDTHIIGLAASMAGVVAQFGKRRFANDNAIGMIHPPEGGNTEVREMVREALKKALTSKSKLSDEEITSYLGTEGQDTFFNADTMLEKGLVDKIITTNVLVNTVDNMDKNELFEIFNKLITDETMDVKNEIELKAIQDEKAVLANKLETVEVEKTTLTNSLKEANEQIETLKAEGEVMKAELATSNKEKAEALINSAIEAGKIKEADKAKWEENAVSNYGLVSDMLTNIQTGDFVIENTLSNAVVKNFAEMTPDEKATLARTNPTKYNELILK
jgi:ATP-dependent protease ClpP protease subunit